MINAKNNKRTFGKYFIGLDIGTSSVGFAVTDINYNLISLNGKKLWGVRLFEEAKTAEERRMFRAARRRTQRKTQRVKLLQELFAEEICKVDPSFYIRLKESAFWEDDKSTKQTNSLFNDNDFTDKDYHKKYPTIYHLRKELMESDEKHDIRLVYLALHHILKHRGHFLFEGENLGNDETAMLPFATLWKEFEVVIRDELGIEIDCIDIEKAEKILKDKNLGISARKSSLSKIMTPDSPQGKELIALIAGATVTLSKIFADESLAETEKPKISFSDGKFDENENIYRDELEDRFYLIEKAKSIYDWGVLAEILDGETTLSVAKVKVYEKHMHDLALLKKIVKAFVPEKYNEVFKESKKEIANYCSYIGMSKKNGRKIVIEKKCTQEDFCKYIKGILKNVNVEDAEVQHMKQELDNITFMPKQISKDNGVIPYQLNLKELNAILEKVSKYHTFLAECDEKGISVAEKIASIMKFRIPYYVGPLNGSHAESGFYWAVKKSEERVYPWNFNEVIDLEGSAEKFIRRMTNKCTYITGADVIAKNSLLYSEFVVLNELNNLKINGEPISVELKQAIYNDLFLELKKVSRKSLKNYLKVQGYQLDENSISGIDGDFKSSMASYIDFRKILGDINHDNYEMIEDIIKNILIFGDDKKLLRSNIMARYGKKLNENQVKNILSLKYSGWGRLSKEFLTEVCHLDQATGEFVSIINALRNTNNNLMQLLSSNFDYLESIREYNKENFGEESIERLSYDVVENLYVSPAVRRGIWQTLSIVKEIHKIMGHAPEKVFIEVTRGEGEKKPTKSRKQQLIELYKNCKEDTRDWIAEVESRDEGDFRNDRLYLYYTQMGRDMYDTNKRIEIADIFDKNLYDIDHIYPQSKVMDDSIENRVLVSRVKNAEKSDKYPLPQEIREANAAFWSMLYHKNLIGKKKFDRLCRSTAFTADELSDFIARQVVETGQSCKAVADILKSYFKTSEIVYVKAKLVSEFRHKFDMIKVREINDYHHAKDAFLNIVVGNVYNTKFTHSPANFIKEGGYRSYNLKKMYEFDVERGEMSAWKAGESGTIASVKKTMMRNDVLFTRQSREVKGGLFDQMIVKKGSGQIPVKGDVRFANEERYGRYNKAAGAYFMLVEHTVKGKRIRTFEFVPVYLAKKLENNREAQLEYCKDILKLIEPDIRMKKIKIDSLLCVDGFYMHLSGRTLDRLIFKNANQFRVDYDIEQYIKKIVKFVERSKLKRGGTLYITAWDEITEEKNIQLYELFLKKLSDTVYKTRLSAQIETLSKKKEMFESLVIEEQVMVLFEILHFFQCNSVTSDLSTLKGSKSAGVLVLSKEISKQDSAYIVNQSPTGIFEQKIDLLTI